MTRILIAAMLLGWSLAGAALTEGARADAAAPDVVARVGDQPITFTQLNTLLNSAAVVGLSLPALGTPERNRTVILLLDKAVSANLIYLDAIDQGLDKDPQYLRELAAFERGILSGLYRSDYGIGEIPVTEEEIQAAHDPATNGGQELSKNARVALEAAIRKRKFQQRVATLRERLRQGLEVRIDESALDAARDDQRGDSEVIARYGSETLTWDDVRPEMQSVAKRERIAPMQVDVVAERKELIEKAIDTRIMAAGAREHGLDQDPRFTRRYNEFRKTRLIGMRRAQLVASMQPSEAEMTEWYQRNRPSMAIPESRKVQMVVLKTEQEAAALKARIEAGELSSYEAAEQYSIDPRAKQTLGEIGWVKQGTGFPGLDAVTFKLGPGQIGGPVQSPAGWHLVKVLDVRDGAYLGIEDEGTRKEVRRRMIHERLDEYTASLRREKYAVEVYQDVLRDMFRKEAAMIAAKTREAEKDPERVQRTLEEIRRLGEGR